MIKNVINRNGLVTFCKRITNKYSTMMKKIMYRAVFNRKKQLRADGKGLIQIEAYLERKRMYVSTHIYIYSTQWDDAKRQVCRHPHAEELNWMIAERMVQMEAMEIDLWKRGEEVTLRRLKEAAGRGSAPRFLSFMLGEIERGRIRESTRENRLTTCRLLEEFAAEVTFGQLTPYFVSRFEAWLVSRGYHTNTIGKHLSHLRIYVNAAIVQGMMREEDNPFHRRRIGHKPFRHTHLTPFEVAKLERAQLPHPLGMVRDAFLFCCYTGLRYSDFVVLTEANIQRGAIHTWVHLTSHKTGAEVRLPVDLLFEGKALHLINIYRDNLAAFFRLPANSTVDKQLLTIARHAGLRKRFSFHSARHTNATLLLAQGVSVTTVQKLLGHKNVRTTMNYCEVVDRTIVTELERARGKKGRDKP